MKKIQKTKQSLVWWYRSFVASRRQRRAAYYEGLRWQAAFRIPLSRWQVFRFFIWPLLRGLGCLVLVALFPLIVSSIVWWLLRLR